MFAFEDQLLRENFLSGNRGVAHKNKLIKKSLYERSLGRNFTKVVENFKLLMKIFKN
jgi:hypothetical protein